MKGIKPIKSIKEVAELKFPTSGRLFSADNEEIIRGCTTDIYFIKSMEIIRALGLEDTPVVAEIFASRAGLMCGTEEVKNILQGLPVKMEALPEGEYFNAKEVVMRITGKYSDFGVYETAVLGILASSSGWATAARECAQAAGGRGMICFGSRHVHPAVSPVMERAAIVGGATGASNIMGAKFAGQEPMGTVPHAVFLVVGDTVEVAKAYYQNMPPGSPVIILVDTFKDEAEEALRVAEALGNNLDGIRLDTPSERGGVTPQLVREVRARLDQAGHRHVKIFISGGLNPERIKILIEAGADAFGVGSYISGAPAIDMTMDLKEVNGKPIAKRGRIPGITKTTRLQRFV
ncbi:nicotinate phosphoribosyltransferase [Desulfohalotomaculum tongense]|uniref:nicotinate phosphoribosyltransferase n=1 Tax=Desulforadius tongensis TaxID=1216062 RepID=UPI001A9C52D1|nr:nicotinate phosphoribosyltransferase [Desulforadius tongensis]MBM7855760.1 nicotinate phosphoribosyltransferase [Desulforadius tongensis]